MTPDTRPLPPDLQSLLDAELRPSETLLWASQPSPARMARLARPQFWMGIPFTLFAVVWESIVLTVMVGPLLRHGLAPAPGGVKGVPVGMAILFPLFGALFVAAGVYQLLAPVRQKRQTEQTVYAVTPQRVLILHSKGYGGPVDTRLLPPEQVRSRSRTQQRDGSGDIVFPGTGTMNGTNFMDRYFTAAARQMTAPPVGFYGIADVRGVDDLIARTFDAPA